MGHYDPTYGVLPFLKQLSGRLETVHANTLLILQRETTIMAAVDDLKAAVTQLGTDVANEITALQAALASGNDAAIEESVTNLKSLSAQLQASVAPKPPTT